MGLKLDWTNECIDRTWYRSSIYYDGIAEGKMSSLPLDSMQPVSGSATMEMLVTGQDAINKGVEYCTWQSPADVKNPSAAFFWYSVRLIQPFNLFHMGWSASWQLATGVGPKQPPAKNGDTIPATSWRTVVDDPSTPYILNSAADQCPGGLKILLTPTAGGEDLDMEIVMSNI